MLGIISCMESEMLIKFDFVVFSYDIYLKSVLKDPDSPALNISDFKIRQNNARQIPVPRSTNINDISGLYTLQQSLVIGSYI